MINAFQKSVNGQRGGGDEGRLMGSNWNSADNNAEARSKSRSES
jgi:hypothetical protein